MDCAPIAWTVLFRVHTFASTLQLHLARVPCSPPLAVKPWQRLQKGDRVNTASLADANESDPNIRLISRAEHFNRSEAKRMSLDDRTCEESYVREAVKVMKPASFKL